MEGGKPKCSQDCVDDEDELFTFVTPRSPHSSNRHENASGNKDSASESDSDEEPSTEQLPRKNGSRLAHLMRTRHPKIKPMQDKRAPLPKKPDTRQSSSRDRGSVELLDSDDDDDLDSSLLLSLSQYNHSSSSVVRDSRALLHQIRGRTQTESRQCLRDASALEETSPAPNASKSMTLRIRIGTSTERFSVGVKENFHSIVERLGEKLQVEPSSLLLTHETHSIQGKDSPESLGISTTDFICGVVLGADSGRIEGEEASSDAGEGIFIRVQAEKLSETYKISKSAAIGKIMEKFAEKLGKSVDQLRFTFDGDSVSSTQTTDDLGMEDEDTIDAAVR